MGKGDITDYGVCVVMQLYDGAQEDHYYLLEELYTVAGLAGANGNLQEAYVYDTYGDAEIWDWPLGDLDRDGQVTGDTGNDGAWLAYYETDQGIPTEHPFADLDSDGDVDTDDLQTLNINDGLEAVETTYSSLENPYFFTGRTTDTLHAANPSDPDDITVAGDPDGFHRLQDNRNRTYDPKHGRWLQRDPNGLLTVVFVLNQHASPGFRPEPRRQYDDGMSLYQYVRSAPTRLTDSHGTFSPMPAEKLPDGGGGCGGRCGADISDALTKLLKDVDNQITSLTPSQKDDLCSNCASPDNTMSWDTDLFIRPTRFSVPGCPFGERCRLDTGRPGASGGMPVTVNGRCYASFDVNYVLLGALAKNCDPLNELRLWFWFYIYKQPVIGGTTFERWYQAAFWFEYGEVGGRFVPPENSLLPCSPCSVKSTSAIGWFLYGDEVRSRS